MTYSSNVKSESKTTARFLATDLTFADSGVLDQNIKMSDIGRFNCKQIVGHPTNDIIKLKKAARLFSGEAISVSYA